MNLVEKILARASGRASVTPGDIVVAEVDTALLHDLSGRSSRQVFQQKVGGSMAHPERIVMVFDHIFSPPSEEKAEVLVENRKFCREYGMKLYDCGSGNIHNVALQYGHVRPGQIVVGSDSHTPAQGVMGCFSAALGNDSYAGTVMPFSQAWFRVPESIHIVLEGEARPGTTARDIALWLCATIGEGKANYCAIKLSGSYIESLEVWDRFLFTLMAVDVGAKCAYIEPDAKTERFAEAVGAAPFEIVHDDPGTSYGATWTWDISDIEPQVACPPTVGNVRPISSMAGTPVQWAELGGHGGGRNLDIAAAAQILAKAKKNPNVNFNIVPGSRRVFSEAVANGNLSLLHEQGATWFPPSTGGNQAVNMGAMAKGEAMISTHVRNFPGRNGSPEAQMFLASSLSVAAAAVAGKIVDPREFM